jgi:hypothetical protein
MVEFVLGLVDRVSRSQCDPIKVCSCNGRKCERLMQEERRTGARNERGRLISIMPEGTMELHRR